MKILADAHIPYLKGVAEQFGEVEYMPGNQFSHQAIKDKDALIVRTVTHFGEEILSDTHVKLICSATIGYDHIDTAYCNAHRITWKTAPGCNANSVEQYITASLLYLSEKHRFSLTQKTIGIVGVGNVGSKVATACKKLGMRVLLNDPPLAETENTNNRFVDLKTLQEEADIITFHTPLTKSGPHKTYHLGDEQFFQSLKKKPFILNSSRGGVIDNVAWKKALRAGIIAGAVIDCWENEPQIDRELLHLADIATPHIAGYSADGKWMATKMSIQNLKEFFQSSVEPKFQQLPPPQQPLIRLTDIPVQKQLPYAIWQTYNPVLDSEKLKEAPEKFTWFRANYPLRREYGAFQIIGAYTQIAPTLKSLGFM